MTNYDAETAWQAALDDVDAPEHTTDEIGMDDLSEDYPGQRIDGELIGREEAEDFERTAEDMEHRARRIEAEREADLEAYWSQLEDEAQDGGDR